MEEETFNDEYYCGPWNDLVELIEVSSKRIVDVELHMYPYSEQRKWHVFKDRNSELFSLLALVRKLKSLISQKLANVSKQMLYTERDNVENISYRLGLLLRSDLPDKAARCYQLIQPLPQEEIEEQIWHRQAVGTDQDSLIDAAFGIISETQPQELVKRIFSQISSICKMIDFPTEVDDQVKEEALRKEISQRTFSFKQDFKKAQVAFIFDRDPSGTIYDLTNEDNLHILQSLMQTYEDKVCTNQKFGESYKIEKAHGYDAETISLFHYHARDVQYFLNDLIKLIIAERKVKELEALVEEEKKRDTLHKRPEEPQAPQEDNNSECKAGNEKLRENNEEQQSPAIPEQYKASVESVFLKTFRYNDQNQDTYRIVREVAQICLDPNEAPQIPVFIHACSELKCSRESTLLYPRKVVDALIGLGILKFKDEAETKNFSDKVGRKNKRFDVCKMNELDQTLFDSFLDKLQRACIV